MRLIAYFAWGPATFVVLLVVGVLLVLGTLLLGSSNRKRKKLPRDKHTCAMCGHRNSANASYCARCGHELKSENN